MIAGKYTVKDLFFNRYVTQIIIPEIQRDYVWGEDQTQSLLETIFEGYTIYTQPDNNIKLPETEDPTLKRDLQNFIKRRNCTTNIGFLYAYSDEQQQGSYFLIDGQQRLTTIYLLLLALAIGNDQNKILFEQIYFAKSYPKLNYHVRESSSLFLAEFIRVQLNNPYSDFKQLSTYFNPKYDNDPTIQNILKNFRSIISFLHSKNLKHSSSFFNYIEEFVELHYFDTNISEQGEELYIFMNARGEQIQDNENLKAALLSQVEGTNKKNEYGKKWEDWQDFFWQNKGKNPNADNGFNGFLTCIAGLESYWNNDNNKFYSKEDFDRNRIKTNDILQYLTFEKIEGYLNAFKYITENEEKFCSSRVYSSWIPKATRLFWRLFNQTPTNWFADYKDDNRATERRNMVYCWSVFSFIRGRIKNGLTLPEAYSLLRIYYVRYNNNERSVTNIASQVSMEIDSGIWKVSTNNDEKFKFKILENSVPAERKEIEGLIWQIEDHPLNLDGSGVRAVNFSHLTSPIQTINIDSLIRLRDKFFELFPLGSETNLTLQGFLLNYGPYYTQISPWYYSNYKFDDWKKTIRNLVTSSELDIFETFWKEYYVYDGYLDDFIIYKQIPPILQQDANNIQNQLQWYYQTLGNKMWECGNYIAVHPEYGKDKFFISQNAILNTKGNMRSQDWITELSTLVNDQIIA